MRIRLICLGLCLALVIALTGCSAISSFLKDHCISISVDGNPYASDTTQK